jgi:uncharacterized repeat protein (TIGR02543 family)
MYRIKLQCLLLIIGAFFSITGCKKSKPNDDTPQITIQFNSNGGSMIEEKVLMKGQLLEQPLTPVKNIWKFDGWYSDKNYTTPVDFKIPFTQSDTIFAKWKPNFKTVSTFAGNTTGLITLGQPWTGYIDGPGNQAAFWGMSGITSDLNGNIYVSEHWGRKVRKISPSGFVSTLAGSGKDNVKDGLGKEADFKGPGSAMAIDTKGNLFVFDYHRLCKITPSGLVSTFAGNQVPKQQDGTGINAGFWTPSHMVFDDDENIIMTEFAGSLIRKITKEAVVTTLRQGDGNYLDGHLQAAGFRFPNGIVRDKDGNYFVADQLNNCIRKIDVNNYVSTFCGNQQEGYKDGNAGEARFSQPGSMAIDKYGNLYVIESLFGSARLRMISPQGDAHTIIGVQRGFKDGYVNEAKFDTMQGITVDQNCNIFVIDYYNSLVRKIRL